MTALRASIASSRGTNKLNFNCFYLFLSFINSSVERIYLLWIVTSKWEYLKFLPSLRAKLKIQISLQQRHLLPVFFFLEIEFGVEFRCWSLFEFIWFLQESNCQSYCLLLTLQYWNKIKKYNRNGNEDHLWKLKGFNRKLCIQIWREKDFE